MKADEEVSGDGSGEEDLRMAALRQQVRAEIAKRSRGGSGGHRSLSEESVSTPDGQAQHHGEERYGPAVSLHYLLLF